jgi:hypothetical protein
MLRLQLACAFLFTIIIVTHAVTPIPHPDNKNHHKIISSAPAAQGHITTTLAPAEVAPEAGTLSDFNALVAGAVADLQQKAEETKREFAPEIEQLKEKEQAAAQALHAAEAQAALKLRPELDKFSAQQEQLRSEAAKAASILGQEFKKVEPVIGAEFQKVEQSLQPLVAQLHGSAVDVSQQIAKGASDASHKLQKQMPEQMQQAKQVVAAAEKALKEDLLADFEKMKPIAESVGEEIQKNAAFLKQWHKDEESRHVQPWDAVEAEVRADMERMGKLFSDHVQRLQQVHSHCDLYLSRVFVNPPSPSLAPASSLL